MLLFISLICLASIALAWTPTGNVQVDFANTDPDLTITVVDMADNVKDVGLPSGLSAVGLTVSGYDIRSISFFADPVEDALHIGIRCWVICGDADGNGNPDGTSNELAQLGGVDQPFFALSESFLIAFDFGGPNGAGPDGQLDYLIGYPASQAYNSEPFPHCNTDFLDKNCFGIFQYTGAGYTQAQYRFRWVSNDPALGASPTTHAVDHNPDPSASRPGLEWSITSFSAFLAARNFPPPNYDGVHPWSFNLLAFAGSFEDDGIGEDFMPASSLIPVNFTCRYYDECDVCGGDSSSCLDCLNQPNGPYVYDACDVCNGDGNSCKDCAGVRFGTKTYDVCDVCGGNGMSCLDCKMIPNGPNRYDVCDVCDGNGLSCLDCNGVPNGPSVYDQCDVCDGDGKSCRCDGSSLVKVCNWPMQLLRSTCVKKGSTKLSQEVWLDPFDGAREIHYYTFPGEQWYGDETTVSTSEFSLC